MEHYRIEDNVYAQVAGPRGNSLFAKRAFKEGEVVFVAYGPIVETSTRYTIPISPTLRIDPTRPEGNLSQYICHSCEPNLGIKERSCFVAMRDIEKDEEVSIDYAMIVYAYGDEISDTERVCQCGSRQCRGKLGSFTELPEELRQKYAGFISDFLFSV